MGFLESENAARIWFVILSGMIPSPKPRPVVVELLTDLSVVLAALSTTADYWRPGVCYLTWYDDDSSGWVSLLICWVTRSQHISFTSHSKTIPFTLFSASREREEQKPKYSFFYFTVYNVSVKIMVKKLWTVWDCFIFTVIQKS